MKVMLDNLIEWILKLMDTDTKLSYEQKKRKGAVAAPLVCFKTHINLFRVTFQTVGPDKVYR